MHVSRSRYEITNEFESLIPRDIRLILCESGLPFFPEVGAFSKLENLEFTKDGTFIAFTDMAYTDRLVVDTSLGVVMHTHKIGIPMTFVNSDLKSYEASFFKFVEGLPYDDPDPNIEPNTVEVAAENLRRQLAEIDPPAIGENTFWDEICWDIAVSNWTSDDLR
jgi:hypothetical protein